VSNYVTNYVPPSRRNTFSALIQLPNRARKATLILSASGLDVQDNAEKPDAFQYWTGLDSHGRAEIKNVVPGTYRVTVYADDVFGQFTKDNVVITNTLSPQTTFKATWDEENAGTELWRLGIPDHSAGEFRHGYAIDKSHRMGLQEYRIFYGAFDFDKDFPQGITYRIGSSKPERDWNYVQWASGNSSTWFVIWNMDAAQMEKATKKATLTLQAAGIRTAGGNEHYKTRTEVGDFASMNIKATVNGKTIGVWTAPHTVSGSCAVRSGIICYNSAQKFVFDTKILKLGENILGISLPKGASGGIGSAKMAKGLYAQWDAIRLEAL
jgi:rhamnogalacturonan endolyase